MKKHWMFFWEDFDRHPKMTKTTIATLLSAYKNGTKLFPLKLHSMLTFCTEFLILHIDWDIQMWWSIRLPQCNIHVFWVIVLLQAMYCYLNYFKLSGDWCKKAAPNHDVPCMAHMNRSSLIREVVSPYLFKPRLWMFKQCIHYWQVYVQLFGVSSSRTCLIITMIWVKIRTM